MFSPNGVRGESFATIFAEIKLDGFPFFNSQTPADKVLALAVGTGKELVIGRLISRFSRVLSHGVGRF